MKAVERFGRHWKEIQEAYFAGRSKNCIKNRWTVLLRRFQNQRVELLSSSGRSSNPTRADFDLKDESMADSDGKDDDSGVSVGFGLSPHTPGFGRCSSWAAEDSPMVWSPQESTCESMDCSDMGNLTPISTENPFGQFDFTAESQWPWQENMVDSSLLSSMDFAVGYSRPDFDSFNLSQSSNLTSSFPNGMLYENSPSISNYPSARTASGNNYAQSNLVSGSLSAVEVPLRYSKPNLGIRTNMTRLVCAERY